MFVTHPRSKSAQKLSVPCVVAHSLNIGPIVSVHPNIWPIFGGFRVYCEQFCVETIASGELESELFSRENKSRRVAQMATFDGLPEISVFMGVNSDRSFPLRKLTETKSCTIKQPTHFGKIMLVASIPCV